MWRPASAPTDAVNVSQLTTVAGGFQSQINTLASGFQSQINTLASTIDTVDQRSRRGIAASAAMAVAMTPSAPGRTTVSFSTGFFGGETGVGVAVAHRLNFAIPLIVHGGYANGGGQEHVGRVGMAFEF
jgi:autotransporter adhesin